MILVLLCWPVAVGISGSLWFVRSTLARHRPLFRDHAFEDEFAHCLVCPYGFNIHSVRIYGGRCTVSKTGARRIGVSPLSAIDWRVCRCYSCPAHLESRVILKKTQFCVHCAANSAVGVGMDG